MSSFGPSSAPLYITVGPPCSGKSTWLRQQLHQGNHNKSADRDNSTTNILDICLDDQPNVYIKIPLGVFTMTPEELNATEEHRRLLHQSYYGQTVLQRILAEDQQEMRGVLQRMQGKISRADLKKALLSYMRPSRNGKIRGSSSNERNNAFSSPNENAAKQRIETLVDTLELFLEQASEGLPREVDLFIREAIFQKGPHAGGNVTAIERAAQKLKQTPKQKAVAWGNTNTKPSDYLVALQVAQKQHRPVYFCVYGGVNDSSSNTNASSLFDLPSVDYHELLHRNLQRMVETGRYIPSNVIRDTSDRTEQMTEEVLCQIQERKNIQRGASAGNPTNATSIPSKLELDQQLARLMNFTMHKNRTVEESKQNRKQWNQNTRNTQQQQQQIQRQQQHNATNPSQQRQWNAATNKAGYSQRNPRRPQTQHQRFQDRPYPKSPYRKGKSGPKQPRKTSPSSNNVRAVHD